MKLHSTGSSGPGLSRIASGTAIFPTSCSSAARATSSSPSGPMCELAPDRQRQLADVVQPELKVGAPLGQRPQQDVA